MIPRDRLRIAVQKSGRLGDPSRDLLTRCGLRFRSSRDKLFCFGENMAVDLLLVRDDDIPGLIADGVCDLGVVGRNVMQEASLAAGGEASIQELRALGFGGCRLSIAIPQDQEWNGPQQLASQRIATTYPHQLGDWLRRNDVDAQIVTLSGSVEIAPKLGTADLICDLVSSGATLVANQLREAVVIMQSEAVLAGAAETPLDERGDLMELLLRRLDGVLNVRESRLLLLQAPRAALDTIVDLLPGQPIPTITTIEGQPEAISLQCVCSGNVSWQELEAMKRAGAQGMLVLPVEKMLA
ncbi:ATP phosphoribosyltransferase [Oleiagrimonas sp.]|jgi:ATP phosphoribosyltransferase|uniref:ATP phosphoribosyltransferase n=1 Tax=Oleiagrimonas sp. TaxID=2010330 RepID=UPI00260F28DF|nr:ATP phosphoribosyltransferase [Oleiagrimonas sp.]MDA3914914.1 ATP phosphoribosyltransferase [Oleiagrimonas sp.]